MRSKKVYAKFQVVSRLEIFKQCRRVEVLKGSMGSQISSLIRGSLHQTCPVQKIIFISGFMLGFLVAAAECIEKLSHVSRINFQRV